MQTARRMIPAGRLILVDLICWQSSAARRLPGPAAAIAGDDAAPAAGTGIAEQPSAAGGMGGADRDRNRDAAGTAHRAGDMAAAGRRNPAATHQEGHAVAGRAVAAGGGENRGPGAVIAAGPGGCRTGDGKHREGGGGKEGFGDEMSGNHG